MLIVGSLLALACGLANSAAAALEKREVVCVAGDRVGIALLAVLARRGWWLLAMALSLLAWVAEAAALGLVPVPVVTTLRSAGRGGLVLAGHRWLGERFGRVELAGLVMLTVGGILTASSAAASASAAPPLSDVTELLVAVAAIAVASVFARARGGLVIGSGVGVVFVATGVFTKEVGDRFVRDGAGAIVPLLATPGLWLMMALSVWAITLFQRALTRANAASVSGATTTVSANGLIVAGVLLYHEPLAHGAMIAPLVLGIVLSAIGAVALAVAGRGPTTLRRPRLAAARSAGSLAPPARARAMLAATGGARRSRLRLARPTRAAAGAPDRENPPDHENVPRILDGVLEPS